MTEPVSCQTLYVCYFGLREPLVQTQVVPYLIEIQKGGTRVSLLTFEADLADSWTTDQIETEKKALLEKGIRWHHLAYHKWPSVPATFFDILNGARAIRKLIDREQIDILHCRVHVPALMAIIARRLSRRKPKIIFDIRGFFPEEYTDAGIWPENGWLYRTAKRIEKLLLDKSDGFVVLTERARELLFPDSDDSGYDIRERPVEVIPCCVDRERFEGVSDDMRDEMRSKLGAADRFVIAYVGSFGGWYLSEELFDLFKTFRQIDPSVFILVLTQRQAATAADRLKAIGFEESDFFVGSVLPAEIPGYLAAADAAVSFIKRCYSKQASSPTKNAEYLAAGVPVIVNQGIGDVDLLIDEDHVGVIVDGFTDDDYRDAIGRLRSMGDIRDMCRKSAEMRFDLEKVGGVRYRRLYKRLLHSRVPETADFPE